MWKQSISNCFSIFFLMRGLFSVVAITLRILIVFKSAAKVLHPIEMRKKIALINLISRLSKRSNCPYGLFSNNLHYLLLQPLKLAVINFHSS